VKKIKSIQKWIPIDEILEKGIIRINKNTYIKILKIIPTNFNLKTQLEKESILNSYKSFFKSCNFDMQILIQSKKEDLSQHFQYLRESLKDNSMKKYLEEYINFIQEKNNQNKSSSKNIYLIIKNNCNNMEENIIQELNEKYFKVKECLLRCVSNVIECNKKETIYILFSFFNSKKFLDQ